MNNQIIVVLYKDKKVSSVYVYDNFEGAKKFCDLLSKYLNTQFEIYEQLKLDKDI